MSPEQITGGELTARSDIYSLGLLLYELFTGKKVFEAQSLHDMIRLRRSGAAPTNPSSLIKGLDPAIERVILRCLEKNPQDRPTSALQVAAALPGGDLLAAALAAGETPSPEMVAAAQKEGSLRPGVAAACLVALLAGLSLVVFLSQRTMLHNYVPLEKSPDVLADRAREIVRKSGYTDPPADSAYSFSFGSDAVRTIKERDRSPQRWEALRGGDPPALYFWFRQSPRYLVPKGLYVYQSDPPTMYSGMVGVTLDSAGRLRYLDAVPPQLEVPQPPAQPDWSLLFSEAGLEMSSFQAAEPRWIPEHYSDARAAWEGVSPQQPQIPIRVEAAAYRGKPVYFDVIYPWEQPSRQVEQTQSAGERAVVVLVFGIVCAVMLGAVLLAWRNIRRGQGDRKGAFRLALFVFAVNMLRGVVWAHHVPNFIEEFDIFLDHLAIALAAVALMWVVYVALEPFVRARWPHRIISWSRLLGGDWRDPLVGRDVLLGGTCGIALTLLYHLQNRTAGWLGWPPDAPITPPNGWALNGLRGLSERALVGIDLSVTQALGYLFIFLLLFIILRRDWLVAGAGWALITVLHSGGGDYPTLTWGFGMAGAALITLTLMRFGLLSLVTLFLFSYLTYNLPLTVNLSAWFAGSTILVLLAVASLAAYGFYLSLGGQRLFRGGILPD
ncbi:MAG: protein kinase [Pyrinomonadaceae bacterium]